MPTITLTTSRWPSAWRGTSWLSSGESLLTSSRATTAGNRVWSSVRRTSSIRCSPLPPDIRTDCLWECCLDGPFLNFPCCFSPAGCHAVCVRVQGHRAGRGAAGLVPAGEQEGVFCRLPVHLLRPAATWRGAGDRLEAQHHGLFYAILHSGHEGVPQQGGSALRQGSSFDI